MKLYFIFTKKGLAVIFAAVISALIIIGQFSTINQTAVDGFSNLKRIEYLNSLGLEVNETAVSVKQTRIPQKIDGVFSEYNKLQIQAGFDISNYCGKSATHYCYSLKNNTLKTVNILIVDGKIIAGDITNALSGEIKALTKEK